MLRRFKAFASDTNGNAMVETALAFSICFFMLVWLMEFCFSLYCQSVMSQAAKIGLQYATMHGASSDKMVGNGSGPGLTDPTGANIAKIVAASMAQSALKQSLPGFAVCPAWWSSGTTQGGFSSSQCNSVITGSSFLGSSSYTGQGDAQPGNIVTVQVVWTYHPYISVPWTTTYSYTATGVVTY
jgi:hypothetical protein